MHIRVAEFDDHPRIVEIQNQGAPPLSLEEFRAREERRPLGPQKMRLVGEAESRIVATGSIRRWESFAEGMMLVGAYVDEPSRGAGLGRQMLERCEQWAANANSTRLVGFLRDTADRERSFAEAAGYSFMQHLFESEVSMQEFEPSTYDGLFAKLKAEGITFKTFDEMDDSVDNRRLIHEAYIAADKDSPGYETWGVPDHSTFEQEFFGAEWFRKEGLALAFDGPTIVGVSALGPMKSGPWSTDFTGVIGSHRGRGIAVAVKVRALSYAKRAGAESVSTNNDSQNAPMLAVNAKLGFKAKPGWIYVHKHL